MTSMEQPSYGRTCRICLAGVEEERESGRLFSPCRCKGTAKYVHVGCLKRWRLESGKQSNYFRCDLCHFEYAFRRTRYANILNSRYTQYGSTLFVLSSTVYAAGFISRPFLGHYYDDVPEGQSFLEHMTIGLLGIGLVGFYRAWWGGTHIYLGGSRRRENASSYMTYLLVTVGLFNVGTYIWRTVQVGTKKVLTRMADDILEVGD